MQSEDEQGHCNYRSARAGQRQYSASTGAKQYAG